jgi:phosphatidylserine/phosphatidylglycerophosphate/cardiolipin synthase-like enzyme
MSTLTTHRTTRRTTTSRRTGHPRLPWAASNRNGGAPVTASTSGVTIFPMPDSSIQPIVDAVRSARSTIDLEIYQMTDTNAQQAFVAAARRGVTMRVMMEPKTVGARPYDQTASVLAGAGIDVKPTPPQYDSSHNVDHAKFMIIDKARLLYGTGNLDPAGLGEGPKYNNRDFWVSDTRPQVVQEAQMLFDYDWNRQPTNESMFPDLVVTPDNADPKILALIDGAQQRLLVYNQEFFDPELNQHVLSAKRRGVDVKVIAGNPGKFFGQHGKDKNAVAVQQFNAAGIPAKELNSLYVHGKGIVADNKVFLGSQNFSTGGLTTNREFGEIFDDPALANQVASSFATDWNNG